MENSGNPEETNEFLEHTITYSMVLVY